MKRLKNKERHPTLAALSSREDDFRDVTVEALKILLKLRGKCVYRGRAWMKLNNAMCWISDEFWKEVRARDERADGRD